MVYSYREGSAPRGANSFHLEVIAIENKCKVEMAELLPPGSELTCLDPIALRKAKIVYNFGFSECNRVKKNLCCI